MADRMCPQRIQRRRVKGWRKPEGAVIVDRSSRWGNPFPVEAVSRGFTEAADFSHPHPEGLWSAHFLDHRPDRGEAAQERRERRQRLAHQVSAALFDDLAQHFRQIDPDGFEAWIAPLRGHDLCCPCEPGWPCHADVLLEIANREVPA